MVIDMNPKQRAAEAAVTLLRRGNSVGLGTGSTADYFLTALAAALRQGTLADIRGVPTSHRSEQRARELGIPLTTLAEVDMLDIAIDGADEVGPSLNLIKGLGGALLREKIVAQNARRFVVIADASKEVAVLGTHSPVPVEVTPFSHEAQAAFLARQGAVVELRRNRDSSPFVTDNGNLIYDCKFGPIPDPAALDHLLASRAGIVATGLFIGIATDALIGEASGVRHVER